MTDDTKKIIDTPDDLFNIGVTSINFKDLGLAYLE